ncbi:MAG: acyltransferase 3 [Edaphobacter sp.]|nr:acyltransferase 3 [Edaphobacter sp.]
MASHLFPGTTNGPLMRTLGATLTFGATGVDLFFVLSGFLITGILFDSLSDSGFFRKFYARRTLRIFPLYYGVLLTLMLLTPWLGIQWHRMNWVLLVYLQNTDIAGPFYSFHLGSGLSLDHFWSLAVEEQFYLVWPLVVFFIRDRRRLLWACLALSSAALLLRFSLAFHHTIYHTINRSTLCRADSLLMGAALALLLRSQLHDAVLRSAKRVFFLVVALVAALNLARPIIERRPDWLFAFDASYLSLRYTLMALGSAALIAWCLRPTSVPRRLFENGALRFFGKYSYGLYVLHVVALGFLLKTFRGWIALVTPSKLAAVAGSGFLAFLVAVVAAYASYNLFEKQFLRLKHHFDYDRPRAPKVAIKV